MSKYYITTTLPYVNAEPHIGFALEIIQADVLARYHKLLGDDVVFNTGTDEHGLKIYRKAIEQGKDAQEYCDEYALKYRALKSALNLSYTNFIRTTDTTHLAAAQEFWRRCASNGDIYKKNYEVKYCVGCELEKTESELADGRCPTHPKLELESIAEENYFFRFSKYQSSLLKLYENQPDFVVPDNRLEEIRKFVERGLEDFSISRLKIKMPWGVPVPDDDEHVMYVWFDALVNYISTLGWPDDKKNFTAFWPGVQVAGKDNLRQQSAMWTAMLLSAGLPAPVQIFIHGFITVDGERMSKSLGNVVNPFDVVAKYGVDAVRYYLLGAMPAYDDGDWLGERFEEYYDAHLANGIGNLTSRIITMLEKFCSGKVPALSFDMFDIASFWQKYEGTVCDYKFDELIRHINEYVGKIDATISETKPWEKQKNGEDINPLLYGLAEALRHLAISLLPVIPTAAEKILSALSLSADEPLGRSWGCLQEGTAISKSDSLFPRLSHGLGQK